MDLAVDSPIISKLFTQGRHRNARVIWLLQTAFPKGKYNTSIIRNAQYMALCRCPADRQQIGIIAERIFDKQKPLFMQIYNDITVKLYSYVLVDNKADTAVQKQWCIWFMPVIRVTWNINPSDIRDKASCTNEVGERYFAKYCNPNSPGRWVKDVFRDVECGGNPPAGWIFGEFI